MENWYSSYELSKFYYQERLQQVQFENVQRQIKDSPRQPLLHHLLENIGNCFIAWGLMLKARFGTTQI